MVVPNEQLIEIFRRASLCRAFEEEVFRQVKLGTLKFPVYLSAGQEYIASTISTFIDHHNVDDKQIFIQHRGHSTYLAFGGNLKELVFELLGDSRGCSHGMGGSASIQSHEKNIYGHDGLMGSQGPIAVGACLGNQKFTLCFAGDASAEEDYFLAALGWASTKKLPILFVVEDNNLSILTEKKVRRCWEMDEVAKAFKMNAFNVSDDPKDLWNVLSEDIFTQPTLINVQTNRLFWHAGAGIDSDTIPDRHKQYQKIFGTDIDKENKKLVQAEWEKCQKL